MAQNLPHDTTPSDLEPITTSTFDSSDGIATKRVRGEVEVGDADA